MKCEVCEAPIHFNEGRMQGSTMDSKVHTDPHICKWNLLIAALHHIKDALYMVR